jgi:pimeloyl-ACP methyl ester carboxylesterase
VGAVKESLVSFYSEGETLQGILRTPDTGDGPFRGIVQGPGWMGLKDANLYLPYHEALTAAGFAVLIFDYRGFGDSECRSDLLIPSMQLEDLINAVTYLAARDDIDSDNIGTFGSGGTGGGNAIVLAASDDRVRCAVSQVPVADGEDWLHRMRSEHEWVSFLERLETDRTTRVMTGSGELVHPREEIMVPTPERRATNVKGDVDSRTPTAVQLRSAEAILTYKPIDLVSSVAPTALMIIAVEDRVTEEAGDAAAHHTLCGLQAVRRHGHPANRRVVRQPSRPWRHRGFREALSFRAGCRRRSTTP